MARADARTPPTLRRRERGAALLVVIVSTAILAALAVELAASTRVSLLAAGNARDDLRAEYAARGAVQLGRLVLNFQKQLDGLAPQAGAGTLAAAGAGAAAATAIPRLQIWNLVSVAPAFTDGLFGKEAGGAAAGPPPATFEARIDDEGRKVNVQLDAPETGGILGAQLAAFLQLTGDVKWDPLFEREDETGQRYTRQDVAIHLHDWTDANSVGSAISANPAKPFEDGFGDESQPYARLADPYPPKNARFESLDELYLVAGIDDAFMSAFGAQLTVYPDKNRGINVNTLDPAELLRNARAMGDPPQQARLQDPAFPTELLKAVMEARLGGVLTLTPARFAEILGALGVRVSSYYQGAAAGASGPFTDRSLVYRVQARAAAGAAERRVDAIVTFDPNQLGQESADLGRLLHWREE